jgi:prevent-host-death family protein
MLADLPSLDRLPRQSASNVKNHWREVVREVHKAGSVAVTNHSTVELVLVDAATYEELAASAAALKERERSVLDRLEADFSQRLGVLQEPGAGKKAAAVFAGRGKLSKRPKAGGSY